MRVAILGCGPAGLIAAHAAEESGHDVTIFSRKRKSETFGAMYLHEPIPGVSPEKPEMNIYISKIGTREGYAKNVYGNPNAPVSWDTFADGEVPAWSLRNAYGKLWHRYESRIKDQNLTENLLQLTCESYDKVFSTIPLQAICTDWRHAFRSVAIRVIHGPARDVERQDCMVYNGMPYERNPNWYRYSYINGYQAWEFSSRSQMMVPLTEGFQITEGMKPLDTDCDCHPEIHRLGRFGKWDKHTFTHHAWREVIDAVQPVLGSSQASSSH